LVVKRPGREADHSLPSSAEVKNVSSYTSSPQYNFMAYCLVTHRDFTLNLTRNKGKAVAVLKQAPRHEDVLGSRCVVPRILNLGTRWR